MVEEFHLSELYKRQLGLVYQERIADQRVLITGHGPALSYTIIMLGYLGVGSSQGKIYFPPHSTVTEEDVFGQVLFEEEDIGRPLDEAAKERLEDKFSLIIPCSNAENLDYIEFDTLIALVSKEGKLPDMPYYGFPIVVQLTKTAVYMGYKLALAEPYEYNILTPSLACIGAALACQEMLRRDNLIRPSKITDSWIELVYHIEQRGIWKRIAATKDRQKMLNAKELKSKLPYEVKLLIGAEIINNIYFEPYKKRLANGNIVISNDDLLLRVKIPKGLFSRIIEDSFELIEDPPTSLIKPSEAVYFSPLKDTLFETIKVEIKNKQQERLRIIDSNVQIPTSLTNKNIILFGAGGLGSWVAGILARSGLENCKISVIDKDDMVEEHNLNRQLLYNRDNIGFPKAEAAENRLKELMGEQNEIRGYARRFEPFHVEKAIELSTNNLLNHPIITEQVQAFNEQNEEELKLIEESQEEFLEGIADIPGINPNIFSACDEIDSAMIKDFVDADVVVTTFDNMNVRWLANVMTKKLNKLMINGGCQEFIGNVDLFNPQGECLVCRYGTKVIYDYEVVSCTERSPVLSIVTTTALAGGLTTSVMLGALADLPVIHYGHFYGKYNAITRCWEGAPSCTHKHKEDCPAHMNAENDSPWF